MIRKVIIGAFVMVATVGAVNAQTKVGFKGGYNLAKITYNNNGDVTDKAGLSTFNAGLAVDATIADIFSIRTGLELQGKGSKYTATSSLGTYEHTVNPLYIELPLNFTVNIPMGGNSKIFVGAGPYAAVGITGKDKWTATTGVSETKGERTIDWGNDNPVSGDNGDQGDFKRFDAGANVIGGIDLGKFAVQAQYGIGLLNNLPGGENSTDNRNNQHRVFGISGILYF
ncbi:MAG: outer membrane beta-barrel protein [Niabella sp.]